VGRHIENRFWLFIGAILADVCKSWIAAVRSVANFSEVAK